jgi:transposase InsO family protein
LEHTLSSNNTTISIGDILYDIQTAISYRIIHAGEEYITLCELAKRLNICTLPTTAVYNALFRNQYEIQPCERHSVFDLEQLPDAYKQSFHAKLEIIGEVVRSYGPTYEGLIGHQPKRALMEIQKKFELSRQALWNYIHMYLKSGLDEFALMDGRVYHPKKGYGSYTYTKIPGRPNNGGISYGLPLTQDLIKIFQSALNSYLSGRFISVRQAFTEMNLKFFSKTNSVINSGNSSVTFDLLPATQRPTYAQLYYFVTCNSTSKRREIAKTSAMENRNNKRLLLSDTAHNARYPGRIFEMDETEFDLSLVSSAGTGQTVGRPIVYAMQDAFSKCITAIGISFDNNSVVGFTNCLMNLADDKAELCNKYGIAPPPTGVWPTSILPAKILSDRGSEYKSKSVQKICEELNIQLSYAPAGTGSMKGNVEQFFHQLQTSLRPYLEDVGLITKRHDSKHHKEASLTIHDFWKIILQTVIAYNQHSIDGYPMTADMIRQNLIPTPENLWAYGCDRSGYPRHIGNKEQFYTTLLKKEKASLGRNGICCNGLFYLNEDDMDIIRSMESLGNKKKHMDVLIDPRDISCIYYICKGVMIKAALMSGKSRNIGKKFLTLEELYLLNQKEKDLKRAGSIDNETIAAKHLLDTLTVIDSAAPSRYASSTDMRASRQLEKAQIQHGNSITSRLDTIATAENTAADPEPIPANTQKNFAQIVDSFDEAMDLFERKD